MRHWYQFGLLFLFFLSLNRSIVATAPKIIQIKFNMEMVSRGFFMRIAQVSVCPLYHLYLLALLDLFVSSKFVSCCLKNYCYGLCNREFFAVVMVHDADC